MENQRQKMARMPPQVIPGHTLIGRQRRPDPPCGATTPQDSFWTHKKSWMSPEQITSDNPVIIGCDNRSAGYQHRLSHRLI